MGMALNYTLGEMYAITQENVELASGIANSVALAVENARLYGETRQRLAESQGVQRVTTSLLRKNSLQEVLEIFCNEALNLTDATGSAVLLLDENGSLKVTSAVGEILSTLNRLPVNGSLAGRTVLSEQPAFEQLGIAFIVISAKDECRGEIHGHESPALPEVQRAGGNKQQDGHGKLAHKTKADQS